MAFTLAAGTQVAIASAYGTSSNVTAATNAANSVLTLAAGHGTVVGDFVEFNSGWELASGRIFRVSAVATNDVTLEGLNTVSTSNYPAGAGVGSVRRITTWTPITQIGTFDVSGGDPNFANITTIADRNRKQIPVDRNPVVWTFNIFDDPLLAWYAPVVLVSDNPTPTGLRFVYTNGSRLVANGYWSIQKTPTVEDNTLRAAISVSAISESVRYAS
jgi:hypothetical protein